MTMYWIYDLPNWQFGLLTVLVFNVVGIGGLYASRPIVRHLVKESAKHNDVVSWIFAGVVVFYGLAVGLIAVATWENYTVVDSVIGKEAAALSGLYNDLDGYPTDLRIKFEGELRDYARLIISDEWPKHRQGLTPPDGGRRIDALENEIMAYEPKGDREKIAHAEVLRSLDRVVEIRQLRMQAVGTGLPSTIWAVVLIGALLNFALVDLFWIENQTVHVVLVMIFATLIALLIFLTAAMDYPFRGEFSVSPDAILEVIDSVMKPTVVDK